MTQSLRIFAKLAKLQGVTLQPHQQRIADTAEEDDSRLLLYHGLGSGKTLSSIAAAETAGQPYTAVVPASLRPNFQGELEKFTDGQTPANVSSYNSLAKGSVPPTDTLIFDEAQRLRNPESQQTQQAMQLANQAKRLYLLSGTPVVNQPSDLAPLVSMLTQKKITPEEFSGRYVGQEKVSPGILGRLRGIKPGQRPVLQRREELKRLLSGHVDYQPTPQTGIDQQEERHTVAMSPEQERLYQGFWGQLPKLLQWKLRHDFPLTAGEMKNLSSFMAGPRQVGLSTLPFMKGKRDPLKAFNQSPKLQKALSLVQEAVQQDPNFRGAAFSNFIDAGLEPYQAALERAGIPSGIFHGGLSDGQRKQLIGDYNAKKLKMLLLGPSGGEGLSLKGTKLLQVLDPHWNEARTRQAIGRGIRFDSHADLPEDQRKIKIQRFISELPPGMMHRLWQRMLRIKPGTNRNAPGTDTYLERMSQRKQDLNNQFLQVLQEVGQAKEGQMPSIKRADNFSLGDNNYNTADGLNVRTGAGLHGPTPSWLDPLKAVGRAVAPAASQAVTANTPNLRGLTEAAKVPAADLARRGTNLAGQHLAYNLPNSARAAGLAGAAGTGAMLGGGLGLLGGVATGSPGRGAVRGAATGAGGAAGSALGAFLAARLGHGMHAGAASLAGGLGGASLGYLGSGAMLGPQQKEEEEEAAVMPRRKAAANRQHKQEGQMTPAAFGAQLAKQAFPGLDMPSLANYGTAFSEMYNPWHQSGRAMPSQPQPPPQPQVPQAPPKPKVLGARFNPVNVQMINQKPGTKAPAAPATPSPNAMGKSGAANPILENINAMLALIPFRTEPLQKRSAAHDFGTEIAKQMGGGRKVTGRKDSTHRGPAMRKALAAVC